MKRAVHFLGALSLALASTVAAALPQHAPVPGGVAVISLGSAPAAPSARYKDRPVLITRHDGEWRAVVGLPLDARPGEHTLEVEGRALSFTVENKDYAEQRLTVKNQRHVNPDPVDLERIGAERVRIRAALETYSSEPPASLTLALPLEGRRSSPFGLRRFFNDQPRNPHSGLDLAAPTGTPIATPAAGRVIETGDFFFNGKSVFIDHGHGLVTMYCHLDRIDVAVGDVLEPGQPLGTVGATGRVTGPHLHWSVALNGNLIDPDLLLAAP